MTRVAIVGPGAVGSVIAAAVAQRDDVSLLLCARRPMGEIQVEDGATTMRLVPQVITRAEEAPPVDWAIVTTKAYDSAGAIAWLHRLCAEGGTAAILQNGVEHRARFADVIPPERLLPVIVDCPAERVDGARVRQRGPGLLTVERSERGASFAALFAKSGLKVTLTDDWTTAAWRKLCLNAPGVISALLLKPAGVMIDEEIGEVSRQLVRECVAVARAEGATLDDQIVEEVLTAYRRAPADAVNSLHADHLAGRQTEIDARNGAIVRLGKRHGIATPANQMAVALLKAAHPPR